MTHFEAKGIVVPIFFLGVQCPVFQCGEKYMLPAESVEEAAFLNDDTISFDILHLLHHSLDTCT
jgi:hypothetical protein